MAILKSFTFITLNGLYKGLNEDTSWHQHGEEESKFSEVQLQADNILLFGRKTYEMMYGFWPTDMAKNLFPLVADRMNESEKIVISNTITDPQWNNTRLMNGDIISQITNLKSESKKDITILGSGDLVRQLSDSKLIDEYEIMIDPVAIGAGSTLLSGLKGNLNLQLIETKFFENSGTVLLRYKLK